jgi:hypothetical protein
MAGLLNIMYLQNIASKIFNIFDLEGYFLALLRDLAT